MHVMSHNAHVNRAPILNGEQPKTIEDSEVALNDARCVARAYLTAVLSD